MNKEILDKLIESFVNEQKGGVEATSQQSSGGGDSLGLDISEIANILVTGTKTDKLLKSSDAAISTLVANSNINFDLSSAESLVNSFSFFDFKSQEVLDERCSSLGGLVSKIALSAGLVSIIEQFQASAAGLVNEAFIAEIMGGQSVDVGAGGIEDIVIGDVGISLKVKATEKLGGSLGNLLETLGIPYKMNYTLRGKRQTNPVRRIRPDTDLDIIQVSQRKRIAKVRPNTTPMHTGGLYYLSFIKKSEGMMIAAYKITKQDVIGTATADEEGFYDIEQMNNILNEPKNLASVADKAQYQLQASLTPEALNEVLQTELAEVFESLKTLDAWFGQMKEKLIGYVSTLEKTNFDELQQHLDAGSDFTFKAFSVNSCPENQVQTQVTENKNNSHFSLDKFLEEVIIKYMNS